MEWYIYLNTYIFIQFWLFDENPFLSTRELAEFGKVVSKGWEEVCVEEGLAVTLNK